MNSSNDLLEKLFSTDQQNRFLCAVIDDSTGERWNLAKPIEPEAFSEVVCAKAWRAMRRAKTWGAASLLPSSKPYFDKPQADELFHASWPGYLNAAKLAWSVKTGGIDEIAETVPDPIFQKGQAKSDELWQRM